MKFTFKLLWTCAVIAFAFVSTALAGCKKTISKSEALSFSESAAADPDEIVDCNPKICGDDIEVLAYVPELPELNRLASTTSGSTAREMLALAGSDDPIDFALAQMRNFDRLATSIESSPVLAGAVGMTLKSFVSEFVGGDEGSRRAIILSLKKVAAEAAPLLTTKNLTAENKTKLGQIIGKLAGDEFKHSQLAKIILSKVDKEARLGLNQQLDIAAAALSFFNDNIVGTSLGKKIEVIERLLDIAEMAAVAAQTESVGGFQDTRKSRIILAAARELAGSDGYINRGDAHRVTSIFQRLVATIADQKIAEGYAQGINQLQAEHPFVYRRWVRRPGGLIGRAVNKNIAGKLSAAHSEKMRAIVAATNQSAGIYETAMRGVGVQRFFLGNDRYANFVDPGADLTLQTVESVIVAITGKGSRQLADSAGSAGTPAIPSKVQNILNRFDLPDGIFIEEALRLATAAEQGQLQLPTGLIFSNGDNGKIRIRSYRAACDCEPAQGSQCQMKFTEAGRSGRRMQLGFAGNAGSTAGCGVDACDSSFVVNRGDIFLPYACAFRYEHKASGAMRVFK